jgi:hypothetical protein
MIENTTNIPPMYVSPSRMSVLYPNVAVIHMQSLKKVCKQIPGLTMIYLFLDEAFLSKELQNNML